MTGRRIRIGTSGWHYPGGDGTWDGIFYPPRGRRHRPPGFDELAGVVRTEPETTAAPLLPVGEPPTRG